MKFITKTVNPNLIDKQVHKLFKNGKKAHKKFSYIFEISRYKTGHLKEQAEQIERKIEELKTNILDIERVIDDKKDKIRGLEIEKKYKITVAQNTHIVATSTLHQIVEHIENTYENAMKRCEFDIEMLKAQQDMEYAHLNIVTKDFNRVGQEFIDACKEFDPLYDTLMTTFNGKIHRSFFVSVVDFWTETFLKGRGYVSITFELFLMILVSMGIFSVFVEAVYDLIK